MPSGWDTAANVISDAAIELGISVAPIADPYAAAVTDPNIIQLRQFLKPLGRKLLRLRKWNQLQQTWTFQTANGVSLYPLPPDFHRHIDQTQWNRTTQLPLAGPLSPQMHEFFLARSATGIVYKAFRTEQDQLLIHPTPTAAETVAFEYISNFWVLAAPVAASFNISGSTGSSWNSILAAAQPGVQGNSIIITLVAGAQAALTRAGYIFTFTYQNGVSTVADMEALINALAAGDRLIVIKTPGTAATLLNGVAFGNRNFTGGLGTLPTKDAPTAAGDLLWFDPALLVAGLKLEWRKAKGFDTTSEQDDFDDAYQRALSADGAAPILSLNRRPIEPLVGPGNVPQTGMGQ